MTASPTTVPQAAQGFDSVGAAAVAEIAHWLVSFLTHGHPDLGRKGAVCPFMEQSLKLGRTAISAVDVRGPRGVRRLENTARSALARLGEEPSGDDIHNSFVLVPVGEDPDVCQELVLEVQQRLKREAVVAGKMIGEFFPGHPMQGVHSRSFRPLASPRPVLAVRTMVVTDILFLTFAGIPAADRLAYLAVWEERFADMAGHTWIRMYEAARTEAERDA
ncbi:DUF6875 domain-containing protein [Streptomyces sp. NEAU-Y11]|uniref:DUF6875 domain-containing protein n=1 Tax=Streptomyces cucumeris TaxID=2962890 RepID=UPI0020C8E416|nr:hypothetical protein [Streptomyces sp. NEAU-Y11]MCP9211178.1 hypothetical protein [Streptomyces sp. NEAU-Y11]